MKDKEIYTERLKKGNRTYYFDIKESENGAYYIKVSESKQIGNEIEKYRILVFEEDIEDFEKSISRLITQLKKFKSPETEFNEKTYNVEEIRTKHKRAYLPWSVEDDEKLELLYCEGQTVKQLSQIFERKEGAIRSRIKKLELKEKYDN